MQILYVDSSPKGERSNSRLLGRFFIDALRSKLDAELDYLDLADADLPHVDALFTQAIYQEEAQRSPAMEARLQQSDQLCRRLLAADMLVCAMPMHNWCYPSVFKVFIDHITRTGFTVNYSSQGEILGQLGDLKCVFITTRGGDLSPGSPLAEMDALTPALTAAFGFLGVRDMTFVDVQPLQFANRQLHDQALQAGKNKLALLAQELASAACLKGDILG